MPSDGIMIHALTKELSDALVGGKVDKILQPEKDEIVLNIRNNANFKLFLSANPSSSRIHLTEATKENPAFAPNFCMLLRKYLMPSKIISIEQKGFERMVEITFECTTEMFDITQKKLIIEIMGRFSNIILTDSDYLIHDAIKQVDYTTSTKRQILPGIYYKLPPEQDKKSILEETDFCVDFTSEQRADKYLLGKYQGFSPLLVRELTFLATGDTNLPLCNFTEAQQEELVCVLKKFQKELAESQYKPCVVPKAGEFYCFPIRQYGASYPVVEAESCSKALDKFYVEKDEAEHTKRITADIFKVLANAQTRLQKKIQSQSIELEESEKAFIFKTYGDMITSEIYKLKQGMTKAQLTDYSVDPPEIKEVPLNIQLTPAQNAQQYYKKYKKAQSAKIILAEQILEAEEELKYIDSVFEELVRVKNREDADEVRNELMQSGYLKSKLRKQKNNGKKPKKQAPVKLEKTTSSDGFTIYYGKNNIQNDYLTLKFADKQDIWFHVKNYPGSHVVVFAEGETVPDSTLTEAAILAATNSKADGKKVAVDYTEVRYVKKPSGAKPGMVIYTNYKTAYVDVIKNNE
ncbi:MAG: NFACT family protein [Clostridia bacterium]|nr:NFACT family protein [Clostridia bacterium]